MFTSNNTLHIRYKISKQVEYAIKRYKFLVKSHKKMYVKKKKELKSRFPLSLHVCV